MIEFQSWPYLFMRIFWLDHIIGIIAFCLFVIRFTINLCGCTELL